jgi:hypothetical protein
MGATADGLRLSRLHCLSTDEKGGRGRRLIKGSSGAEKSSQKSQRLREDSRLPDSLNLVQIANQLYRTIYIGCISMGYHFG